MNKCVAFLTMLTMVLAENQEADLMSHLNSYKMEARCTINEESTTSETELNPRRINQDLQIMLDHLAGAMQNLTQSTSIIDSRLQIKLLAVKDQIKNDVLQPLRQLMLTDLQTNSITENVLLKYVNPEPVLSIYSSDDITPTIQLIVDEFPTFLVNDDKQKLDYSAYDVIAANTLAKLDDKYLSTFIANLQSKVAVNAVSPTVLSTILTTIRRNMAALSQMIYNEFHVQIPTKNIPLLTTADTYPTAFVSSYQKYDIRSLSTNQKMVLLIIQVHVKLTLEYQLRNILAPVTAQQRNVFDIIYNTKPTQFDYVINSKSIPVHPTRINARNARKNPIRKHRSVQEDDIQKYDINKGNIPECKCQTKTDTNVVRAILKWLIVDLLFQYQYIGNGCLEKRQICKKGAEYLKPRNCTFWEKFQMFWLLSQQTQCYDQVKLTKRPTVNRKKRDIFGIGTALAYTFGLSKASDRLVLENKLDKLNTAESQLIQRTNNDNKKYQMIKQTITDLESGIDKMQNSQEKSVKNINEEYKNLLSLESYSKKTTEYLLMIQQALLQVSMYRTHANQLHLLTSDLARKTTAFINKQVPEGVLKYNPNSNVKYNMQQAKQFIKFQANGFKLTYSIPAYRDTFSMYKLHSIPFAVESGMVQYKLMPKIGMTQDNKYITPQDLDFYCTQGTQCTCDPTIPLRTNQICESTMLDQTREQPDMKLCNLKILPIATQQQSYIVSKNIVYLSAPKPDTVQVTCNNRPVKKEKIKTGVNTITVPQLCTLKTSQLEYTNKKTGQHTAYEVLNLNRKIQEALEKLQNETLGHGDIKSIADLHMPYQVANISTDNLAIKQIATDIKMIKELGNLESNIKLPNLSHGTTQDIIRASNIAVGFVTIIFIVWVSSYCCCRPIRECTNKMVVCSCSNCYNTCHSACATASATSTATRYEARTDSVHTDQANLSQQLLRPITEFPEPRTPGPSRSPGPNRNIRFQNRSRDDDEISDVSSPSTSTLESDAMEPAFRTVRMPIIRPPGQRNSPPTPNLPTKLAPPPPIKMEPPPSHQRR